MGYSTKTDIQSDPLDVDESEPLQVLPIRVKICLVLLGDKHRILTHLGWRGS